MSINATVQKIVDDLFADQLVKGLEATEQITWIIKNKTGYDPKTCLLYTSPSPRDATLSRMPSSA